MIHRAFSACGLLLAMLLVTACHNPGGPSSGFRQIVVTGPESIAPGATGQFTATGIHFNGDSENLTSQVTWKTQSKSPYRATLEPSPFIRFGTIAGQALGLGLGEATVQALYSGTSSEAHTVMVQPPGTYRVTGVASDSPAAVQSATVELVSGVGAGQVTTTNYWGEFAFYGVSGTVVLQVSAPGYEATSRTISVLANRIENFELRSLVPPASLAGTWDLSITLPSTCRSLLPAEVQTRHQVATITQTGDFFDLATPLMVVATPPQVRGRVLGKDFSLYLPVYDDQIEHNYWEESIGAASFDLSGSLAGIADDDGVHGTFDGSVGYRPNPTSPYQSCKGPDGSFLMTRRAPANRR